MSTMVLLEQELNINDVLKGGARPEEHKPLGSLADAKLAPISAREVDLFKEWYARVITKGVDPSVRNLLIRNAEIALDCMRIVKNRTGGEFAGLLAEGTQITGRIILPYTVDTSTPKRTWLQTINAAAYAAGFLAWFATRTQAEEEATVIFGLYELSDNPVINGVQFVKNGETFVPFDFDFEILGEQRLVELPAPFVAEPESQYSASFRVFSAGSTKLRPVGFQFGRAMDFKTLAQV